MFRLANVDIPDNCRLDSSRLDVAPNAPNDFDGDEWHLKAHRVCVAHAAPIPADIHANAESTEARVATSSAATATAATAYTPNISHISSSATSKLRRSCSVVSTRIHGGKGALATLAHYLVASALTDEISGPTFKMVLVVPLAAWLRVAVRLALRCLGRS